MCTRREGAKAFETSQSHFTYRKFDSTILHFMHFYFLIPEFTSDYGIDSVILLFDACTTRVCVALPVVDDDISEKVESFYLTLERTSDLDNRNPSYGEVTIYDDDGNIS